MRTIPRAPSRTESESTIKVHEEDEESKYGTVASWHTAHQGSEVNGNVKDVFRDQDGEEEDDLEWAAVTDEEDHLVCYIVCHVSMSLIPFDRCVRRYKSLLKQWSQL